MRHFEDFTAGEVFDLGSVMVSSEEIVDFARRFDPQPFHLDERAAAASPFGGLVASGWHTASLFMRLYVETVLLDAASVGSPGVEHVRWPAPVRPGDTLTGTLTVLEAKPSARNPRRGTLLLACEMRNQDGAVVLTLRARGLFARRPDAA